MERAISSKDKVLDNNYPLMEKLRERAPGTFSHSKNVASMLTQVAAAIDIPEDNLVIAGFYHDIGKIVVPQMFTENQITGEESGHKILPVRASMRYITAHIGDTARILVNDANMPPEIIRWCTQHHGTAVAPYFYAKARKENPEVNIDNFRYPGPRPECLEAALLMICDILEATSRSKDQAGKLEDVGDLVEGVISRLVEDEQLDAVTFNFAQIRIIKEVLKKHLAREHHKRIDYDEEASEALAVAPKKKKKPSIPEE